MIHLVLRAQDGDDAAFAELITHHRASLLARAFRLTGNREDALDAVQDATVAAFQRINDLRDPDAFGAWMLRLLQTASRGHRRRNRRSVEAALHKEMPGAEVGDPVQSLWLGQIMSALPHRQAELLRDYHLSGMTVAELARASGRPAGTIQRWLFEARAAALKEAMHMERVAWLIGDELTPKEIQKVENAAAIAGLGIHHEPNACKACDQLMAGEGPHPAVAILALDEQGRGDAWMVLAVLRAPGTDQFSTLHAIVLGPAEDQIVFRAWKAACGAYLARPTDEQTVSELARYLRILADAGDMSYETAGG